MGIIPTSMDDLCSSIGHFCENLYSKFLMCGQIYGTIQHK